MAILAVQKVNKSSAAKVYTAAAAGGDSYRNHEGVFVHVRNTGIAKTITIVAVSDPLLTAKAGSLDVPDLVLTVPGTAFFLFSVPPAYVGSGGLVSMAYDDESDLTIAILQALQ